MKLFIVDFVVLRMFYLVAHGIKKFYGKEKLTMKQRILFVTGYSPFGSAETFSSEEILDMSNLTDYIVVPRSYGREVLHERARDILPKTVNIPLFSSRIIAYTLCYALTHPVSLIKTIKWCALWSWTPFEFVKCICILPKSIYAARLMRSRRIAHIHCTGTNTMAVMGRIIADIDHIPWSFTLHSWSDSFTARKRNFRIMLKDAAFCRTISNEVLEKLSSSVGQQLAKKCKAIHIGTRCMPKSCTLAGRKNKFVIATPAGFEYRKGHHVAIEASKRLHYMGIENFIWIFYGCGTEEERIKEAIRLANLGDNIKTPGVISNKELLGLYEAGKIDLVVLPSIDQTDPSGKYSQPEGIPHALIQAAGFGIPVVSTDSGGSTELTGDGAGIVVPQGDSLSLAKAIAEVMSSPNYYSKLAANVLEKAQRQFNRDETSKQLVRACLGLCARENE